jgi:hypothetical protein
MLVQIGVIWVPFLAGVSRQIEYPGQRVLAASEYAAFDCVGGLRRLLTAFAGGVG